MRGKAKMAWGFSIPLIAAGRPSRLALVLVSGVRQLSRSFGTVWLDPKRTNLAKRSHSHRQKHKEPVNKPEPVGESNNTAEKPQQPVVNIKGFPNLPNRQAGLPWALGSARLLSARAALSALVTVVQNQRSRISGRNQGPSQRTRRPSDSKPFGHLPYRQASLPYRQAGCRKARRNYQSWSRAVPRASAPGDVYERSNMSVASGKSIILVYERGVNSSELSLLINRTSNLTADRQHTRIANTFTLSNNRRSTLSAHFIGRSSVTRPESRPWPVRFAGICPRTNVPALGAAAAFWFFFAAEKELGHAPAMRGSIKFKNSRSLSIRFNLPIQPKRQLINTSTIHSKTY